MCHGLTAPTKNLGLLTLRQNKKYTCDENLGLLEGTALYAGLHQDPVEGFGLKPNL